MGMQEKLGTFEQHESEVRSYCRKFDRLFVRAQGSALLDDTGRRYIDFLAGCGSLNYGHNDPDMVEALVEHLRNFGLCAGLDLHTQTKQFFLETFVTGILAPRSLPHRVQFTGPTGANAIEAALKLARKITGRYNVVSFTNGYHGVSLGALAVTGNRFSRMQSFLPGVTRAAYDGYHGSGIDTADLLERMLDDPSSGVDAPAAFILEVVQGEGGLNTASRAWVRKIAALARRHGAKLIIDDIQAGCGRTGTFFSFEGMGIEPDMIVLSKSISGFGLPMSLVLVHPDADQWQPAEHNGTFRGNNLAFVTATVAIQKYWSEPHHFESEISRRADRVHAALSAIASRLPGSRVKGRGLMQGLDVVDGALAERIQTLCFQNGLIVEACGPHDEVVKIMAPLNTPMGQLDQGLEILSSAVDSIEHSGTARGRVAVAPWRQSSAAVDGAQVMRSPIR